MLLWLRVEVLQVLVTILQQEEVKCFLPCFAEISYVLQASHDVLVREERLYNLLLGGAVPQRSQIPENVSVDVSFGPDRSSYLLQSRRLDQVDFAARVRVLLTLKEWVPHDVGHL